MNKSVIFLICAGVSAVLLVAVLLAGSIYNAYTVERIEWKAFTPASDFAGYKELAPEMQEYFKHKSYLNVEVGNRWTDIGYPASALDHLKVSCGYTPCEIQVDGTTYRSDEYNRIELTFTIFEIERRNGVHVIRQGGDNRFFIRSTGWLLFFNHRILLTRTELSYGQFKQFEFAAEKLKEERAARNFWLSVVGVIVAFSILGGVGYLGYRYW
jgi:hypothetical protein